MDINNDKEFLKFLGVTVREKTPEEVNEHIDKITVAIYRIKNDEIEVDADKKKLLISLLTFEKISLKKQLENHIENMERQKTSEMYKDMWLGIDKVQ